MRIEFSTERRDKPEAVPTVRATVRDYGTVQYLEIEAREGSRLLLIALSSKSDMSGLCGRRVRQPLTGRDLLTWESLYPKMWEKWHMMSDAQALKWALEFPAFNRGRTSVPPSEALAWALNAPGKDMSARTLKAQAKRAA